MKTESFGDAALDERKALHEWVVNGNSVFDNAWGIASEDGNPLSFIEAFRLVVDMSSYPEDYGL
jgi:hypothetical protein